jgi:hypothetical protein
MNRNELGGGGNFKIDTASAIKLYSTERDYQVLFARFIAHTRKYSFISDRRAALVTARAFVYHVKVITAASTSSEDYGATNHDPSSFIRGHYGSP